MEAAVPYAVDEQMRVEALRAAAAISRGFHPDEVVGAAELFLRFLLDEKG